MLFNGRIHRNPKKYTNPHELARAIDEYVSKCNASRYEYSNKSDNVIPVVKNPPSIAGLCLHLGFSSKRALLSLMSRDNPTLRGILESTFLWIENFYITESLQPNASRGYETMLRAMGYSDNSNSNDHMKISRTTTTSTTDSATDTETTFKIEFVRPTSQLDGDDLKRQLMLDAGDDQEVVSAIERQLSNQPSVRSINEDATVSQTSQTSQTTPKPILTSENV